MDCYRFGGRQQLPALHSLFKLYPAYYKNVFPNRAARSIVENPEVFGQSLPVADPQLLSDVADLLHVVLGQVDRPALPVLLQPGQVLGFGDHPHLPVQAGLEGDLAGCFAMLDAELLDDVVFQQIKLLGVAVAPGQRSVGEHVNSILLGALDQALLQQVRMALDLQQQGFNLAEGQEFVEQLPVEVRDTQVLGISFLNTKLKLSPDLLEGLMQPPLPLGVHVHDRPVQIVHVYIVQLHQSESLFEFQDRVRVDVVKRLGGNKQVLPLASVLSNDGLDGLAQGNLIIVVSGSVYVLAVAHLQATTQQAGQDGLVLYFVGAEANEVQDLLVGEGFGGGPFFLPAFVFGHYDFMKLTIQTLRSGFKQGAANIKSKQFSMVYLDYLQILLSVLGQQIRRVMKNPENLAESYNSHYQNNKYETPNKLSCQLTAEKTLKKSIEDRIHSGLKTKSNQLIRKLNGNSSSEQVGQDNSEQEKLVLDNQSLNFAGFYEYVNWQKLHALCFSYVDKPFKEDFWRVLRLVNYGQVLIPTGLVFEIVKEIRNGNYIGGFQKVIDTFLEANKMSDRVRSFKQLQNYTPLRLIEQHYKGITQKDEQQASKPKRTNRHSQSDVFTRNFLSAQKKATNRVVSLTKKVVEDLRHSYSIPKISTYSRENYESLVKPERECHCPEKHRYKNEDEKFLESEPLETLFKAKNIDKSIFQGSVHSIPGVLAHFNRAQYCYAQKLQQKRASQRPGYSSKKIY